MDKAARIFYHVGWIVGVAWLVIAVGQVYIGLQGRVTTNFDGWGTYTWLGVGMFILGVAWIALWYFQHHYQRSTVR